MKKKFGANIAFLILISWAAFCVVEVEGVVQSSSLQNFIKNLEKGKGRLQGVAVAIVEDGHVVYKMTSGRRKRRRGPIAESTLFSLASVSKAVSSTMLAWLVEQRKIDLDKKYRLSCVSKPVSLRQILSHTTGYKFSGNTDIERGASRAELLKKLRDQKIGSKSGGSYFYSNTLFSLIEEILAIEHISFARAFIEFCLTVGTDEVRLWPLSGVTNIAYPHKRNINRSRNSMKVLSLPSNYSVVTPASAGVFASVDGMAELLKVLCGYRPDVISGETLNEFYRPQVRTDDVVCRWKKYLPLSSADTEAYYGLGWRIFRAKSYPGKDFIWHSGWLGGANTFVGFIPKEKVGIVILVNQDQKHTSFTLEQGFKFWGCFLA